MCPSRLPGTGYNHSDCCRPAAAKHGVRAHMARTAKRWLFLPWGCLACAVMIHYASGWFPRVHDPRSNELQLGFALGAFYGWPAWLALPVLATVERKSLPRWHIAVLLVPPIVAVSLYTVGRSLSAGGL